MKKLIPILIFVACILPLAWPSNWPIIYPNGWWKITTKLPSGKPVVEERLPDFKLSQGMLHITPGGKHTFGTIKEIIKHPDQTLICLLKIDKKQIVIPADYGNWIDLESILSEEWMKDSKNSWE